MKSGRARIETTLGELMRVASQIAFERSDDAMEARALTSLILVEMLRTRFSSAERGRFGDAGKISLN